MNPASKSKLQNLDGVISGKIEVMLHITEKINIPFLHVPRSRGRELEPKI